MCKGYHVFHVFALSKDDRIMNGRSVLDGRLIAHNSTFISTDNLVMLVHIKNIYTIQLHNTIFSTYHFKYTVFEIQNIINFTKLISYSLQL